MAFRPTLRDYQSVGDPVITADWYMLIPLIPGASNPRALSYKVNTTSMPGHQIEQVPYENGARKWNFAGRRIFNGTWTATLVETSNGSSRGDLINWMNIARPYRSGNGAYKSQYGVMAELRLYDAANNIAVLQEIYGLFPLSIDDASLDQGSAVLQYSINFSYDEVLEYYGVAE